MTILWNAARWACPLFWLGISSAAFFTFHFLGGNGETAGQLRQPVFLLPLGWASLVLSLVFTALNTLWRR